MAAADLKDTPAQAVRRARQYPSIKARGFAMKLLPLLFALMVFDVAVPAGEQAPITATQADLHGGLQTALDCFSNDCGRYPTTSEGFKALLTCPANIPAEKWHGPYLSPPEIPKDPWHHPYVYLCPGTHNTNGFDLYSCGFDGISKSGGNDPDDINNWDNSSPHGGNDRLYTRDVFVNDFRGVPALFVLWLILQIFLGGFTLIAPIFSTRARVSIARHPIMYGVWFLLSLAAFLCVLSIVSPIHGR